MNVTSAPEQDDDLRGYDSIIAITQDTVNSQLLGLYNLGIIDDEIIEENDRGSVNTQIKAPTVTLQVKEAGKFQAIILNINFGEGELRLESEEGAQVFQLEHVVLGFRSYIEKNVFTKSELLESDNVTREAKDVFRDLSDQFDIEYLYVSLEKTVTQKSLARMEGLSDLDALKLLVELLAQHYSGAGAEVSPFGLGFQPRLRAGLTLQSSSQKFEIPSLVPTSVDHSLTLNSQKPNWSTFNFLIMTQNRLAPAPRPYIDLQMVDSPNQQGRYLVAERLILQDGLLRGIQQFFDTEAPFTWDDALKRWILKNEIVRGREEKTIDGSRVMIETRANLECRVNIPRRQQPIELYLDFDSWMQLAYTVNDSPGDMSPAGTRSRFGARFEINLKDKDKLYLHSEWTKYPDYESNHNMNRLFASGPISSLVLALRDAYTAAFVGGTWAHQALWNLLTAEGYLNMGRAVLPLGKTFFFSNVMINGVKNSNLQVDLTYKD